MTVSRVGVIGENLVDLLVYADGTTTAVAGGGPFNVARTVARLGQPVTLFSGVSADVFGRQLRERLDELDITTVPAHNVALPSTVAIVDLTTDAPSYFFHLDNSASVLLEPDVALTALHSLADLAALYFGTLGLLVEPMCSTGERLFAALPDHIIAVVDPNCRPSATRDKAAFVARLERLMARTDVVKVSTEDLDYLFPGVTPLQSARTFLTWGAALVVVTDGAGAVHALTAEWHEELAVPATDVVDTVGAGDALIGGFVSWWIRHDLGRSDLTSREHVREGVAAAIVVAATTCTRQGAEPPFLSELATSTAWR